MEFSHFMTFMFDVQDKFPGLRWDLKGQQISLHIDIPEEVATLLADAREMFSPL